MIFVMLLSLSLSKMLICNVLWSMFGFYVFEHKKCFFQIIKTCKKFQNRLLHEQ